MPVDKSVIAFCNQRLRTIATTRKKLHREMVEAIEALASAENKAADAGETFFPAADAVVIEDGSPNDGRPAITWAHVHACMARIEASVERMHATEGGVDAAELLDWQALAVT